METVTFIVDCTLQIFGGLKVSAGQRMRVKPSLIEKLRAEGLIEGSVTLPDNTVFSESLAEEEE